MHCVVCVSVCLFFVFLFLLYSYTRSFYLYTINTNLFLKAPKKRRNIFYVPYKYRVKDIIEIIYLIYTTRQKLVLRA